VGEIQRLKPPKAAVVEALSPVPSQRWKRLDVKSFTPTSRAIEVKNVLVAETLLGTAPGAKVAAFGPNNYVGILLLLFQFLLVCTSTQCKLQRHVLFNGCWVASGSLLIV
jgi:hypothetical protein